MRRQPIRAIWKPLLAMSLPGLLVLSGLFLSGGLAFWHAMIAVAVMVAGLFFLTQALLSDIAALRSFTDQLAQNPDTPRPDLFFIGSFAPLVTRIRELVQNDDTGKPVTAPMTSTPGLDRLPDPVLMLDQDRNISRANLAARELLGDALIGRDISVVLRNPALLDAVDNILSGAAETAEIEFDFSVPVARNFSARISGHEEDQAADIAVVIALYDITALKQSETMRSDFIANVSHELRTPLAVMLGSLQTLQGPARNDADAQEKFLGLMENQADRMSGLVDDLLALSRIEMNEHAPPTGLVDVSAVIDEAKTTLALKAEARNIRIEADYIAELNDIPGDKNDLTMIFQNLIDNALKYGAEGSTVTIRSRMADESELPSGLSAKRRYIAISVEDQGAGIDANHIPRLTERFYRVDSARSKELGGTGLGLAIVKHAANRHRGALVIESKAGRGSVFTIFLPLSDPAS